MKKHQMLYALLIAVLLTAPLTAFADQPPDMIAEKMATKLVRGVTNTFTSFAEIPKQSILTVREMGAPGYAIGPLKGFGMALYRGFIGVTETFFFMIPQPGYYDPTIEPSYIWEGWESKRETSAAVQEETK